MDPQALWDRYQKYLCTVDSLNLALDISRMDFSDGYLAEMKPQIEAAYAEMAELEKGAIANADEQRMVGHYWLRNPQLAPTAEIRDEIEQSVAQIKTFAADVHAGRVKPPGAGKFTQVLSIGIGGSALGPMFVADALGQPGDDKMRVAFVDNTDPDGIARTLAKLKGRLTETLCIVITKSGGTPDTRNGMMVVRHAFESVGLDFEKHVVAVTMKGSKMDQLAENQGWIARFPMFDWVGGRTSELSAVGLLPAALQGLNIEEMLAGAAACDEVTRGTRTATNPSALLALMWYHATGGKGQKDMVMLPYKDRLLLLSRYLQQLVMESLGKRLDREGNRVDQGIAVYGNKGSTDQHAYVQQLRDGVNNFFVTFIHVLEAGHDTVEVEPNTTAGDYLNGFQIGTREALFGNDRQSMTLTVGQVDARTIGVLIALFERAVGFYGSLVNINAYHQPGVEAGKKAAAAVLDLQNRASAKLSDSPQTAGQLALAIDAVESVEIIYLVLEHLAANGRIKRTAGAFPAETTYCQK
ncbi:MAG: glucose-6-phosphate isomerase [Pirellulales bacterium]|nr:glucose-6-phosphate isomerase [Pirellulales bacterium]